MTSVQPDTQPSDRSANMIVTIVTAVPAVTIRMNAPLITHPKMIDGPECSVITVETLAIAQPNAEVEVAPTVTILGTIAGTIRDQIGDGSEGFCKLKRIQELGDKSSHILVIFRSAAILDIQIC